MARDFIDLADQRDCRKYNFTDGAGYSAINQGKLQV